MGKLTWKVVLHPYVKEDGTQQVRLRLTKDRASRFVDTGIAIHKSQWNKKATPRLANWLTSAAHDYEKRNEELRALGLDYEDAARANPTWDFTHLDKKVVAVPAEPVLPPEQTDFVAFAEQYVRGRAITDKPSTIVLYSRAVRDLKRWRGGAALPFAELSEQLVLDFYAWLVQEVGNYAATARDKVIKLSTIAKRAVKKGLLRYEANPFLDLPIPRIGNKKPVSRPPIAAFEQLLAVDFHTVPASRRADMQHRRRVWLLQHYLRGTRVSDILLLRERNVLPERILLTERKTGKLKSIRRTPQIDALLSHYPPTGVAEAFVLPFLDHTKGYASPNPTVAQQADLDYVIQKRIAVVNFALQVMAREVGIPRFTSHAARHLFVDRLEKKQVSGREISALLGHSSEAVTRAYRQQLGYDELDEAAESAFV